MVGAGGIGGDGRHGGPGEAAATLASRGLTAQTRGRTRCGRRTSVVDGQRWCGMPCRCYRDQSWAQRVYEDGQRLPSRASNTSVVDGQRWCGMPCRCYRDQSWAQRVYEDGQRLPRRVGWAGNGGLVFGNGGPGGLGGPGTSAGNGGLGSGAVSSAGGMGGQRGLGVRQRRPRRSRRAGHVGRQRRYAIAPPGIGFGSGMSASASAQRKAPQPDSAAAAPPGSAIPTPSLRPASGSARG